MNIITSILVLSILFSLARLYRRNKKSFEVTNKFSGWIQKSDFSSTEIEDITLDSILDLIETTNWKSEHEYERNAQAAETKSCSAGIGIVFNNQHIFHICPNPDGSYLLHFHYGIRGKILFFIPTIEKITYSKFKSTKEELIELLLFFFKRKFDVFENALKDY
jgi:hypothetical protein